MLEKFHFYENQNTSQFQDIWKINVTQLYCTYIKQTIMCCHQWNNIKCCSSQKWCTLRFSVEPLLFLIHISDINYEIVDSNSIMLCHDSQIFLGIKDEEDTQMLQNDLHKLFKWADTNNMKFNENKFELLQYGKEQR